MREFFLSIVKFILLLLLIPLVAACAVSFHRTMLTLDGFYGDFAKGAIVYLIVHLFIVIPDSMFQVGKNLVHRLVNFSEGLSKAIIYAVPFYPLLAFAVFLGAKVFFNYSHAQQYFMFFLGLTLAMHLVLSAKDISDNDFTGLRLGYFASIGLVFIGNIMIAVLLMSAMKLNFPVSEFFKMFFNISFWIYKRIFLQLFG